MIKANPIISSPELLAGLAPSGYVFSENVHRGRKNFVTAKPEGDETAGVRSYLHSANGLAVCASELRYNSPVSERVEGSGVLKIHVRLAGESRVGTKGNEGIVVPAVSCGVLIHPSGSQKYEHFQASTLERSVTVACTPQFFCEEFGLENQPMHRLLVRFLEGGEVPLSGLCVPLLLETRRVAEDLFKEFCEGPTRALMIESHALELLARIFDQLATIDSKPLEAPILGRDRRIAEAAREILDRTLETPPSLKHLAREVGTHTAKLMRLFKAIHGTTISHYVESTRMERARMLLARGELTVTQIAFEVGYEHPGNFATAFKRFFGVSPSQVREEQRRSVG